MSIISEYYRHIHHLPFAEDFAPIIRDAVEYVVDKICEYWGQKAPSGGVDLSDMPGADFGFMPMEVQVLRKMPRTTHGRVINATTLLSDERHSINADKDFVAKMAHTLRAVSFFPSTSREEAAIQRSHMMVPPPVGCDIYAISQPSNKSNSVFPILYNLDLGEIYYTELRIEERKSGKLHIKRSEQSPGAITAVNWITGKVYYIGMPVLALPDPDKSRQLYMSTDWHYRRPVYTHALELDRARRRKLALAAAVVEARRAKGAILWKDMRASGARVIEESMSPEEINDVLRADPFALTRAEMQILERKADITAKSLVPETPPEPCLGSVSVMTEEERAARKKDATETKCATFISIPRKTGIGMAITTTFLERLYELPSGCLDIPSMEVNPATSAAACMGPMQAYYSTLCFMGPLFQAVLQTATKNTWFIPMLISSIRSGGVPLATAAPEAKSIRKWLGLNKPDFEKLMSMPNEGPLVFMIMMNQIAPTSYKTFERCYKKVEELDAMWLKEYDKAPGPYGYGVRDVMVKLKNRRGRILFETLALPQAMAFFAKHNLRKTYTPLQYLKYIVEEGKRSCDPETGKGKTLRELEMLLRDYNRMAKEIAPRAPYALPHNLLAAHDTMVDNYNRIVADKEDSSLEEYTQFARCYADKLADVCPDEKFTVLAPVSSEDLYEEGILLNHCVGSYGRDIIKARGQMLIYFLRLRTKKGNPLVTIQVDRGPDGYVLTEVAGKGNRKPTEEEQAFCERWIRQFNAAITSAEKKKLGKDRIPGFDATAMNWLTAAIGINTTCAPAYNAAKTKDENYISLYEHVYACVREMLDTDTLPLSKRELTKRVYAECGRLKLTASATQTITGPFERLLKKTS